MLFMSDEDRDRVVGSSTRNTIQRQLRQKKVGLHVVVDQRFSSRGQTALGVAAPRGINIAYQLSGDGFFEKTNDSVTFGDRYGTTKKITLTWHWR